MTDDDTPAMRSASYRLPVADLDFLLRDELRGVRFQLEYQKAELVLRDWGVSSTIVVFGSARAAEAGPMSHWYDEARKFGRIVSERGGALAPEGGLRDNVIMTGGGPGIMEAANRGASDIGAPSIGLNIVLPHEQRPNLYSTPELTLQFHYFAMRKMHFAMRANALAVFPGGFGTMDEMFELLTLVQTRKAPPVPIVLVGRDYWSKAINFDFLVEQGVVAPADLELFELVDDAEAAWESLVRRGLVAHGERDVTG
jgi:uncharacterized protein (TIGR00730 family)